ncbi:MAG: alpha-glucan family phosphorylase [Bacteroidales bacterium]|jgi:phosphorylase/glycogen(starch) synthase
MPESKIINPDYIFEVSWEVCNKVGGIYTVISTKALTLTKQHKNNLIFIGPDVWKESTSDNPDFTEDKFLFKSWREQAESKGFRIKVGRWNIEGRPVAILIDFTTLFPQKDVIFAGFWEKYNLDSISGQWDYVEPALFGYAAGTLIENFYLFNNSLSDKVVAQFHEWMTGTGLLYLHDNVPQIGTIFTTHATVAGRCISGNGLPLYENLSEYNGDEKASQFHVTAKHSLEKTSANTADCFTTVSEITAKECAQLLKKDVDVITPNGFEDSFVPPKNLFDEKRMQAKEKLFKVGEALLNQKLSRDSVFVAISGRYEFHNKGIDLFIDALSKLNQNKDLKNDIIAYILVPAGHYGPRKVVLDRMENPDFNEPTIDKHLTHRIQNKESDPILKRLSQNNLRNLPEDKVKVIFVPCYLNGYDGLFNMHYYDVLIGIDVTVFPSYYEPWGYTPLESLAFHVPTVTTTLSGFGMWIKTIYDKMTEGAAVIERTENNNDYVVSEIVNELQDYINRSEEGRAKSREQAFVMSRIALWKNLIKYYEQAYNIALSKVQKRASTFKAKLYPEITLHKVESQHKPIWRRINIESNVPKSLEGIKEIASNLWWTWNPESEELFEYMDCELWNKTNHNPVAMINSMHYSQFLKFEKDKIFTDKLKKVHKEFTDYISKSSEKDKPKIAYVSMEFGFHDSLKTFSGGLGILAGDYLKEASDCNHDIIGISLLYRNGYFIQQLSLNGAQLSVIEPQHYSQTPLKPVKDENGEWKEITLAFPGRTIYARIWKVDVGRVPLYLLDTDYDKNSESDRSITYQLYGGDWENRLKQELLLGVGGIRLLDALDLNPDIYHCNEGHAAFLCVERLRKVMQNENRSFLEAMEIVKSSNLFTTHTPVPAGHDAFSEDMLRTYLSHYPDRLNLTWNEFMSLGKLHADDSTEKFSMSYLAARLSSEINGVSKIHGRVSQKMFSDLWEGYFPEESHVSYVTNGVHYPTWTAGRWRELYETTFEKGFLENQSEKKFWKKIHEVPDKTIWDIRQKLRKELMVYVNNRIINSWTKRQENTHKIIEIVKTTKDDILTIGFARRFATYKRAYLLFKDINRLNEIVNDKKKPVQFIFAGKAHPQDKAGQESIKAIFDISRRPEFMGKILFVENYDMELAKKLVQGVDVWLNNPRRPLEASGTSGEKATMNGVLNFSVMDGWWAEGYVEKAGWALEEKAAYNNEEFQDELDAVTIYNILENEIIPMFYKRDANGIPKEWISYIKKAIAEIAPKYNTKRMIEDYYNKFYNKLYKNSLNLKENDFMLAKKLAHWKKVVSRGWESIEIVSVATSPDVANNALKLGHDFHAEVVLDLNELSVDDIGIEIIFTDIASEQPEIIYKLELTFEKINDRQVKFICDVPSDKAGTYNYGFRIFPKNPNLIHRQDLNLIRWF